MKVSKKTLKRIISEELGRVKEELSEGGDTGRPRWDPGRPSTGKYYQGREGQDWIKTGSRRKEPASTGELTPVEGFKQIEKIANTAQMNKSLGIGGPSSFERTLKDIEGIIERLRAGQNPPGYKKDHPAFNKPFENSGNLGFSDARSNNPKKTPDELRAAGYDQEWDLEAYEDGYASGRKGM